MSKEIPAKLVANCGTPDRAAWLDRLPETLRSLEQRWSITLDSPFESEAAWVAPVTLTDGTAAVLKLGMPHMEGEQEAQGLLFWNGDPTVRVLKVDSESDAFLLERCHPGTTLRTVPEEEQDLVIAGMLRRLWRLPPAPSAFRPLSGMMQFWSDETLAAIERWPDAGLVREGLRLFQELPRTAQTEVLLATDLHAGNVLRATREPWLVIDPKPFVGDPAYDATQHLFNCPARMRSNPRETIRRFADLLSLDHERVRLWMFARAAAEPGAPWGDADSIILARALA
jgi:streptomycin 6-kinase